MNTRKQLLAIATLLAAGLAGTQAQTITLWNFNSLDGNSGTGTTAPAIGSGAASLLGGPTATFASGNASGGSTDPELSTDDTAWNLTTFPGVTAASGTAGARFTASTVGFANIEVSLDLRTSNTSSRYWQFLYSTDGVSFTPHGGATVNGFNNIFTSGGGDVWNNNWTVSLMGVSGVDNNPNFTFQLVSVFSPVGFTQTTGALTPYGADQAYRASAVDDRAYATSGTARFDMVEVVSVPEPTVLSVGALGVLALIFRQRVVARRN
jgi:hypothetical protein